MRSFFVTVFLTIAALSFVGCGGEKGALSGLYPCEGTVTYNGSPATAGVSITFYPDGGDSEARAASANTDANGKFKVTTLKPNDGMFPGTYKVAIAKYEEYGPPRQAKDSDGNVVGEEYDTKNVFPEKYASPDTSGLTVTIEKKKNTPEFNLVD